MKKSPKKSLTDDAKKSASVARLFICTCPSGDTIRWVEGQKECQIFTSPYETRFGGVTRCRYSVSDRWLPRPTDESDAEKSVRVAREHAALDRSLDRELADLKERLANFETHRAAVHAELPSNWWTNSDLLLESLTPAQVVELLNRLGKVRVYDTQDGLTVAYRRARQELDRAKHGAERKAARQALRDEERAEAARQAAYEQEE